MNRKCFWKMIFIGSFESYSTIINNENASFFRKTILPLEKCFRATILFDEVVLQVCFTSITIWRNFLSFMLFYGGGVSRNEDIMHSFQKVSRKECFLLASLNLIRQSCVVLRETFVQLGKSFRGGTTTHISCESKSVNSLNKFLCLCILLYTVVLCLHF